MYKHLYDCFQHFYNENGAIYIISDTHFSDEESYRFRFPEEFDFDDLTDISEDTKKTAIKNIIEHLDAYQIKNINRRVGKNDCLILLGDVGNTDCIAKLKAGYKVLILGNHDVGATTYKKQESFKELPQNTEYNLRNVVDIYGQKLLYETNNLFDEVYEGTLQISPKIILSHEPVDYKYCFNIHGHVHPQSKECFEVKTHLQYLKDIKDTNLKSLNCCAEYLNYEPINFNDIIKSGVLKEIEDIHRSTIDRAIERKIKNNNL